MTDVAALEPLAEYDEALRMWTFRDPRTNMPIATAHETFAPSMLAWARAWVRWKYAGGPYP